MLNIYFYCTYKLFCHIFNLLFVFVLSNDFISVNEDESTHSEKSVKLCDNRTLSYSICSLLKLLLHDFNTI